MTPTNKPEHPPILEDRGALLLPSNPPAPGTIRVLLAPGCTWTWREVPGATQFDIVLVTPPDHRVRGGSR